MDTGGLAQMTYNGNNHNNSMSINSTSLGVPGSGFASRGKGQHIKRLNVTLPSRVETHDDSFSMNAALTPRTSRSHLLAGLRTAPRQPSTPSTAPLASHQRNTYGKNGGSDYSHLNMGNVPHTARPAGINHAKSSVYGGYNCNSANLTPQMYSLPEHVLAPPALDHILEANDGQMDENLYADLVQTNMFLAAQQQRLQQQLAAVTAAAQQFQSLNIGTPTGYFPQQQQQHQPLQQPMYRQPYSPAVSNMSAFQKQAQQGMQPVVQAVPGRPGVYSVYNPMTGQQNFVVDNNAHAEEYSVPSHMRSSPSGQAVFKAEISPPVESLRQSPVRSQSSSSSTRMPTPSRNVISSQSPPLQVQEQIPAKWDHKRGLSFAVKVTGEGDKNNTPKSAAFPPTPATGTFGPGQGRAGEHAIRQPRGPPPLEELITKPTSKCEGSKNFVTRQRRQAVHSLVKARMERRSETRDRDSGNCNSGGSVTPSSEAEFGFSSSDGDDLSTANSSLCGKPSLSSLRAVATGAIGSERKDLEKEKDTSNGSWSRSSNENLYTAAVMSQPAHHSQGPQPHRKTPMLVLTNAEKRKGPSP